MDELIIGDKPIINYGQNYFNDDSTFNFSFEKHFTKKILIYLINCQII
jgi:hypothetical protein